MISQERVWERFVEEILVDTSAYDTEYTLICFKESSKPGIWLNIAEIEPRCFNSTTL